MSTTLKPLIVQVYVTLSPEEPSRPMISTTSPSPERADSLRKQGCEIHRVNLQLFTKLLPDLTDESQAIGHEVKYLGRRVQNNHHQTPGTVTAEDEHGVVVTWHNDTGYDTNGTFSFQSLEKGLADGKLRWVE